MRAPIFVLAFWRRSKADPAGRREAYIAYHDAEARRDTRAMHDRWPALKDATTAQLRAETGRG